MVKIQFLKNYEGHLIDSTTFVDENKAYTP